MGALPEGPDRIIPDNRIACDDCEVPKQSMCDQHSVDRIAVKQRKRLADAPSLRGEVENVQQHAFPNLFE